MAKKVRGSHRGDLAAVRNCAIARSVAIALRTGTVRVSGYVTVQVN
jgi:hypothetical protein